MKFEFSDNWMKFAARTEEGHNVEAGKPEFDIDGLLAVANAAPKGPWRWQGEDYRGSWGWQMLVDVDGKGLIVGQDEGGGPCGHLKADQPIDAELCLTGFMVDDRPHVEPIHVYQPVATFIKTFDRETVLGLINSLSTAEKVMRILREEGEAGRLVIPEAVARKIMEALK